MCIILKFHPSGRKVTTLRERKRMNARNSGYLLYVDTSGARAKNHQSTMSDHISNPDFVC